jgi:hypothetical protein
VVNLSGRPLAAASCLQTPQERGFATRRIPELPRDHAGEVGPHLAALVILVILARTSGDPHDGLGGLHVLDRHRRAAVFLCVLDAEQPANGQQCAILGQRALPFGQKLRRIAQDRILDPAEERRFRRGMGQPTICWYQCNFSILALVTILSRRREGGDQVCRERKGFGNGVAAATF